jgi:hypothetical protein
MLMKLIAGVSVMAALVAGGGATWSGLSPSAKDGRAPRASDCCYPGSDCCYPGSPCCGDDCCAAGAACCYPPSACCFGAKATRTQAKAASCCATGSECCDPPQDCCFAGAKAKAGK